MRFRRNTGFLVLSLLTAFFLSACGGGGGDSSPPPPPTSTTAAATGISLHVATLNGTVNPNGQATNAWFEWGTDNALASPTLTTAQAIGAGSTDSSVSASITGLTMGTTYYYRVAATNASGTQKGTIASFTTALPNTAPAVTTNAATSVTISGAVLNGTVNPNELSTTGVFEWGTDSNLATYSTTSSQSLGAGTTSVAVTATLSGLTPGTTYYFRVAATNSAGTSRGSIGSFNTVAQPPTVTTAAADNISITGATLHGSVNPNGLAVSDARFEYGTDSTLATFSVTSLQTLAAGFTPQSITATLPGLTPATTYYFRVVAINSAGTTKGSIVSFVTVAQPPTVATAAADNLSITGATLHGTVNPNGLAVSDAHFEYGTDSNLATFSTTSLQTLAAGMTAESITALPSSALIPGTTYYFRVVATNSAGTSKGLILSFDTVAPPPTVVTSEATSITSSGATLNGTVNPNGLATDAYFEWGTDPTLASNFTTSTQAMGSGGSAQAITASLSGLTPGATYYFRVVATNAGGTSQGTILTFPTPYSPDVTTNVPTSITTASAIFNGGVNPNGLSTTAWFEYGTDPSLSSRTSTASQAMGSGSSPVSYNRSVSGLSSYTTYYYRAVASNSGGTQKGVINSFRTGETYVAVGDSITAGSDGTQNIGGYEPTLADLLGVMIENKGVSGATSADGADAIGATLSAYPSAKYYLILYGTNDAFIPAVTKSAYKNNMQTIISAIISAGKTPYLAKVPYATAAGFSDASIQEYNAAIDELRVSNGISAIAPDFYTWFLNHPSQLADGIHPNATGYQSMATLWFNALP